ncbi:LOW QUALITY PROTEIN: uncharacterized protein ACR2FA_008793 [Aphomia sociella]
MQPTIKPTWLSWPGWDESRREHMDRYHRRRMRLTLHDLRDLQLQTFIDWSHLPRQEITVYTPKQLRHLIRLDNSDGGRGGAAFPTSDGAWRQDRYSLDTGPWRMPDLQHIRLESAGRAGGAGGAAAARRGAARGWAAGAVLLAVLILLVRAIEKCLHRKFFNARRRRSEEWPTPTVLATSNQLPSDVTIPSETFHSEINQDTISNDLPPPYSECANTVPNTNVAANKLYHEEPPPPYSACYVAYSNPKDGIPSVHFYNRRRENMFENRIEVGHSSTQNIGSTLVNGNEAIKPNTDHIGCDQSDSNREFIFENGRIIEREGFARQCHRNVAVGTATNVQEVPGNVIVNQSHPEIHVVPTNEINSIAVPDRVLPV